MVDDQEDNQGRDGEKILKDLCLLFRTVPIPSYT